ncbi:helix-turn-helix domain-containing protein [Lentzea sp. NPDC034063]|uniref:helix-turn-helix domain-containing protein n=1 Tax=unclassified Lentzea TaxID=2643253 RepID=UPI00340B9CB7
MINACHLVTREDRLRIVRLGDEQNNDPQFVADMFGIDRSFAHQLLRDYRTAGPDSRCFARSPGRSPAISEQQLGDLHLLLRNQAPRKFGFGPMLWMVAGVRTVFMAPTLPVRGGDPAPVVSRFCRERPAT